MENRKSLKLFIFISAFVFTLGIAPSAFAYEVETHAYLTDEAINFYNQNYSNNPIKDEFKSYIIDGSRREDDAPRWTNHFYDPVNNLGLNDPRWGSGFSSKEWAQSDSKQTTFINKPIKYVASMLTVSEQENIKDMDVNFTWQQAVRYYRDGKIEKAMFVLGHVLHLIEDASVPDHTRNDGHPEPLGDGSPYEIFSSKFSLKNPDTNLTTRLVNKKPFDNMPVLSNYFDEMAKYSNNNFYSEDTIEKVYSSPNPEFFRKDGKYSVAFRKDEYGNEYRLYMKRVSEVDEIESELSTLLIEGMGGDKILIDYWSRLSTKSIQVAAGVINLFFNDIARVDYGDAKPINDDRNPISWAIDNTRAFAQITASFGRAITSSVANTVSNFSSQVADVAKGIFSSVADIVKDNAQIPDQNLLTSVSLGELGTSSLDENNNTVQPSEQKIIGPSLAIPLAQNELAPKLPKGLALNLPKEVKPIVEEPKVVLKQDVAPEMKQLALNLPKKNIASSTQNKLLDSSAETSSAQKQNIQVCSFGSTSLTTSQTSKTPTYQKLLINELAWMGSVKNSSDEWIELRNISGSELNISNWQILDKEEQIKIAFPENTKISAGGFLLLERTDDNSAPNVKADIIYTGALSNSDEALRLFDDKCGLIDEVFANSEWPAGDAPTKRTMERQADLGWWTYNGAGEGSGDALILGTPKKENMVKVVYYGGSGGGGGGAATAAVVETNNNSNTQPLKILISEVRAYPTDNRFVELYNPNDSAIDLTNWYLQRKTQSGDSFSSLVSKTYFDGKTIGAHGYFVISRNAMDGADIVLDSLTLTESNTIQLKNSISEVADIVGWGQASDCDGSCAVQLLSNQNNQSIQRKFQDNIFIDTDNNAADFEIQTCPSPKAQSKSCAVSEINNSNQAPSAFFDFSTTTPKTGEEIIFNAASSTDADGNIALYDWNFGDNQLASSTQATTTHSYLLAGNYNISLTVFDNLNATSTYILPLSVASSSVQESNLDQKASSTGHILISEILFNPQGSDEGKEFIELYNPADNDLDLRDWSLRILKNNATSTDLLAKFGSKNEDVTLIKNKGFLLIGFNNYTSTSTPADIARSIALPNSTSTIYLIDKIGAEIDQVNHSNILENVGMSEGQSLERKALSNGICVSAQDDGEFLGNGCDSEGWEIRDIPNSQNSQNFPEPRNKPIAAADFIGGYDKTNKKINLSWNESRDYSGATSTLSYLISDISANSVLGDITTSSTTAEFNIGEIGRDYVFEIKAIDGEGLSSDISTATVSVAGTSIEDVDYFILNKTETSGTMGLSDRIFKPLATGVIDSMTFNINTSRDGNIFGNSSDVDISLYEWLGGATTTPELGRGGLLAKSGIKSVNSYTGYPSSNFTLYFSGDNQVVLDSSKYYYFEINITSSGVSINWSPYVVVKAVSTGIIGISSPTNNYVYEDSNIDLSFKYLEPSSNKYNAIITETRDFYTDAVVDNYRVDLTTDQKTIGWHNLATTTRTLTPGFYKTKTTLACSDSCESNAIENEINFSVFGAAPMEGKLLNQNDSSAISGIVDYQFSGQVFRPAVSGKIDGLTLKVTSSGGWVQADSYWNIYEWNGDGNNLNGTAGALLASTTPKWLTSGSYYPNPVEETWDFDSNNEIDLDSNKYYFLTLSVVPRVLGQLAPTLGMQMSDNGSLIDGRLIAQYINQGDLYLIINKK